MKHVVDAARRLVEIQDQKEKLLQEEQAVLRQLGQSQHQFFVEKSQKKHRVKNGRLRRGVGKEAVLDAITGITDKTFDWKAVRKYILKKSPGLSITGDTIRIALSRFAHSGQIHEVSVGGRKMYSTQTDPQIQFIVPKSGGNGLHGEKVSDGRKTRWKRVRMGQAQKKVWASYTPEQKAARLESLRLAREKRKLTTV